MGFLFGFSLPVERLPLLVVGPAIAVAGLVFGYLELKSPSPDLFWCAVDLVGGIALTAYGVIERRKRTTTRDVQDAEGTSRDS